MHQKDLVYCRILEALYKKKTEDITESIEVNEVVESTVFLVSNFIKKSRDNFKINYATDLSPIDRNFQRLEQVMVNLLHNVNHIITYKITRHKIRDLLQ